MPKRKLVSLSVPSELRPMSNDDVGESISIETQIVDPISTSSNATTGAGVTTFKLPHSGILQRDLRYQFTVSSNPAPVTGLNAFSMCVGAMGCISRIVMKTSNGQILHDIDQSNFLSMIQQNFVSTEVQNNLDRAEMGNVNPYEYVSASVAVADGGGQLRVADTEYRNSTVNGYSNQRSGFKTRVDDGSTWCVQLSKLLPVLSAETSYFPLFIMKEDIIIEIHKASKDDWLISGSAVDAVRQAPIALPASVQLTNEQLVMNTIHYPAQSLTQIQQRALNRSFPYIDYTLVRRSFGAVADGQSLGEQTIRVGLQGRTLRNMYAVKSHPTDKNVWNGAFYSCHNPAQTWNFKINDMRLFNNNVDNPCREHDLLEETRDDAPQIPLQLYSNTAQQNVSVACFNDMGIGNKSDLAGRMNILGVDMRIVPDENSYDGNGIKVGTAPTEFSLNYNSVTAQDADSNKTTDLKLFYCYARSYSIDGQGSLITSY